MAVDSQLFAHQTSFYIVEITVSLENTAIPLLIILNIYKKINFNKIIFIFNKF